MNVEVDKRFGPYLALSYSRFYPDITFEQALRPEALDAARQIVNLCCFLPPEDPERIAGTGGDVRRSSISDEFEQSASSPA